MLRTLTLSLVAVGLFANQAISGTELAKSVTLDELYKGGTLTEGAKDISAEYLSGNTVLNFDGGCVEDIRCDTLQNDICFASFMSPSCLTITAWINPHSLTTPEQGHASLFSWGSEWSGFRFGLRSSVDDSGSMSYNALTMSYIADPSSKDRDCEAELPVTLGDWQFVAYSVNVQTGEYEMWADGQSRSGTIQEIVDVTDPDTLSKFCIGAKISTRENPLNKELFYGDIANMTFYISDDLATLEQLQQIAANSKPIRVPEPATGTLSLLALAALAARRRKK